MIPIERAPEPPSFDERVRKPGQRWLAANPTSSNLPSHWRGIRPELAAAFEDRCACTAMSLMTPGTVDHFVSIKEDRDLAYEWSNYRYAAGWVNSKKSALRSDEILDPCGIGEDWFELELSGYVLRVTDRCPEHLRARARFMLRRLGLDHAPEVVRHRRSWHEMHEKGLPLAELDRLAPLVARAIRKQQARCGEPTAESPEGGSDSSR
jgi:hypothetical protein